MSDNNYDDTYNDEDFDTSSDNNPYYDTDPETRMFPSVSEDDYETTQVFPNNEEYDNSNDLSYYAINNLPQGAYSNGWVAGEWYESLYIHTDNLMYDNAELSKEVTDVHAQNEMLREQNNEMQDTMHSTSAENESFKARNESREHELDEREVEQDEKIKKMKIFMYCAIAAAILGLVFATFFGVKYSNEVKDNRNNTSMSSVQEEQLNGMKEDLTRAQQQKNDAEAASKNLQGEVDRLNTELKTSNDKLESAEKSLEESNKTMDEMTEKINSLSDKTPETRTVTSATTITEQSNSGNLPPVTVTETTPPGDRSDTNSGTSTTTRNNN